MSTPMSVELKMQLLEFIFSPFMIRGSHFLFLRLPQRQYLARVLWEQQLITTEDLENFVHKQLMLLGERMFNIHMKTKYWADFLDSPEALGYWLAHGGYEALPFWRRGKIRFDQGETREQFGEKHKGLAGMILAQIIEYMHHASNPSTTPQKV